MGVVLYEQLIVLDLEIAQGRCALHSERANQVAILTLRACWPTVKCDAHMSL